MSQGFQSLIDAPNKYFRDYPSYYPSFERLGPRRGLFTRLTLGWTPSFVIEVTVAQRRGYQSGLLS